MIYDLLTARLKSSPSGYIFSGFGFVCAIMTVFTIKLVRLKIFLVGFSFQRDLSFS